MTSPLDPDDGVPVPFASVPLSVPDPDESLSCAVDVDDWSPFVDGPVGSTAEHPAIDIVPAVPSVARNFRRVDGRLIVGSDFQRS